jgi:hypothetical protein
MVIQGVMDEMKQLVARCLIVCAGTNVTSGDRGGMRQNQSMSRPLNFYK